MANKYIIQRRTASGLETVAEVPAIENGKVDLSWLPVVGAMGSAIIERGSNANGEYIRWADGTQICIFNSGILGASHSALNMCVFPAEFAEIPDILPSIDMYTASTSTKNSNVFIYGARASSITTTSCQVGALSIGAVVLTNGQSKIIAIGRWK